MCTQQQFPNAADWLDPLSDARFFRGLTLFDVAVVRGGGAADGQRKVLPLRGRPHLEEVALGSMNLAEEAAPPSLPLPNTVLLFAQSLRRQPLIKRAAPAYIPNPKGFIALPPMPRPDLAERVLSPAEMVAAQIAMAMEHREQQRRQRVQGLRQRLFHHHDEGLELQSSLPMPAFVPSPPVPEPVVIQDETVTLVNNMQELMQATYQHITHVHKEPRKITIEELSPTALQRMLADTIKAPQAADEILHNEIDTEEMDTENEVSELVLENEPMQWHPSADGGVLMAIGDFDPNVDRLVCHTEGMTYTLRHRLGCVTLRFTNGDSIRFTHPDLVLKKQDVLPALTFV